MEMVETTLKDVWVIKPDIHTDFRGEYVMTWNTDLYGASFPFWRASRGEPWVEHDISTTLQRGTLRGIRYSPRCWKLNQGLQGAIYYVVVNCDVEDSQFGVWEAFVLSHKNRHQLLKHPRYGSGFLTLTDNVLFHYLQSQYYDPENPDQKTFMWDDPRFNIWWPIKNPILSQRDELVG